MPAYPESDSELGLDSLVEYFDVTPLTASYPLVTLGFAALVLRERIHLLQWGWR